MPALWRKTAGSQRGMPTLPQRLRRPHPWLAALAFLALLTGADLCRRPDRQWLATGYGKAVAAYQWTKGRLGFAPCCRFYPSCSHYSAESVRRYGLCKGLRLTAGRLERCRASVPTGTLDLVPDDAASLPPLHQQP